MSKRVLVVDDEENIRQMTLLTLEAAGYEVGEAGSGMEAFAILGSDALWDVILLDQKMPGMVGIEVLKRIKVLAPTARVIMVTAFASVELAVEAMQLGASDFVRKPMTPEIVRNAVAAALLKSSEPRTSPDRVAAEAQAPQRLAVTMNGFTILRCADVHGGSLQKSDERHFLVRKPDGREQEVVVEISSEATASVEPVANRLPLDRAFWTEQAERFISDFIWNDGAVPASGRLVLKGVDADELEKFAKERQGKDRAQHI
ncbi:MAG: response regulator [Pyrinomonadaceae bacterium]|nr:response regulator [Pyrinomonadaceae bacterium]